MITLEIREVLQGDEGGEMVKERIVSVSGTLCSPDEFNVAIQELTLAQQYFLSLSAAKV